LAAVATTGGSGFDPFEDQCRKLARYGTSGGQGRL